MLYFPPTPSSRFAHLQGTWAPAYTVNMIQVFTLRGLESPSHGCKPTAQRNCDEPANSDDNQQVSFTHWHRSKHQLGCDHVSGPLYKHQPTHDTCDDRRWRCVPRVGNNYKSPDCRSNQPSQHRNKEVLLAVQDELGPKSRLEEMRETNNDHPNGERAFDDEWQFTSFHDGIVNDRTYCQLRYRALDSRFTCKSHAFCLTHRAPFVYSLAEGREETR